MTLWTALTFQTLTLLIQNHPTPFQESEKEHLLISSVNLKAPTQAMKAWETSHQHPQPAPIRPSQVPGTTQCQGRFHGEIIIARREKSGEIPLCRFKDGSALALSSLSYANQDLGQ